MRHIIIPVLLFVLPAVAWADQPSSLLTQHTLSVDGLKRTYYVFLPASIKRHRGLPLVIFLQVVDLKKWLYASQLEMYAKKKRFILVVPMGYGSLGWWNSGNCCGEAFTEHIDDVKFISLLIDKLLKDFPIDHRKIYVIGMSNGGMMAYRSGYTLSDKIAAIAPVAGSLNDDDPHASQPVSVIAFHGTADKTVAYYGSPKTIYKREDKSVAYATHFWVKTDGCSPIPHRRKYGNIIRDTYEHCKNETEVVLYTIKGGGHHWPGAPKSKDKAAIGLPATKLICDFFLRHPKKN